VTARCRAERRLEARRVIGLLGPLLEGLRLSREFIGDTLEVIHPGVPLFVGASARRLAPFRVRSIRATQSRRVHPLWHGLTAETSVTAPV
jgi:hypothetical protein